MVLIMQWNLQSYYTKFNQLKILLRKYSPACICLQETRHKGRTIKPPSGYNLITSSPVRDDDHDRGTIILVHKSINYDIININTTLQAVAVKIYLDKVYTVCSIYLPHIQVTVNELSIILDQLNAPFFFLGDMNARSPLWGESFTCPKGRIFETLVNNYDISILNDGNPTHFHIQTGSTSTIDLSLCSSDILPTLDYSISDSLYDSDHYPIMIETNIDCNNFNRPIRYDTSRADWKQFQEMTNVENIQSQYLTVDDFSQEIEEKIITAADACIPKTSGTLRRPPVPWWNQDCQRAMKERLRSERALKKSHTIENLIRYKRARAHMRYICKQSRELSWKSYVSKLNKTTDLQEIWKRVKKISGKYPANPTPIILDKTNNELVSDKHTVANILADSFAAVAGDHNYSPEFLRMRQIYENRPPNFKTACNDVYNKPITMTELKHALSKSNNSSPGKDLISYSMIKSSHITLKEMILKLFNHIFVGRVFPLKWKLAIIVPVPKPNKDHKDPANYRPISLTSCLCKLLERIINDRLVWYLETHELIHFKQSGFRKHRSTTDHLIDLECAVRNAMDNKQHTIIVFFDLQKAYDTASKHIIMQQLYNFGMRGNLPIFISNFLSERLISVRVGNAYSSSYNLPGGVPQGSVLSCTLFLLTINSVATSLPVGIGSTLYVDDFAIYASGALTTMIERRLQTAVNRLSAWASTAGMTFSPSKTVAMHICRKHNCMKIVNTLTFNNIPILTVDTKKFLGLHFDSSMTWREHITRLRGSCNKILDLFKHLSYKHWGADRTTLLRLYTMMMKPKLDYGCEAYRSACRTLMDSLPPIQNAAIRIATGAFRSSPVLSLLSDSDLLPFRYSHEAKILNYACHILANDRHPHYDKCMEAVRLDENDSSFPSRSFLSRLSCLVVSYNIDLTKIIKELPSKQPPWLSKNSTACENLWKLNKSKTTDHEFRDHFARHRESHTECQSFYTDGSRTNTGAGCAFVYNNITSAKRLPIYTSNFSAELIAIDQSLTFAVTNNLQLNNIIVHTDCRSAIQSILQCNPQNTIVQQIQQYITEHNINVTLCWVPSHVGILENERADKAARNICNTGHVETDILLPRNDIRSHIKYMVRKRWGIHWSNTISNKLRDIKPTTRPLINTCFSDRFWERIVTRLRIGHTNLTHSYLMSGTNPPYCEDCIMPLTVKHILVECPSYRDERLTAFSCTTPTLKDILINHAYLYGPLYRYLRLIDIINDI